MRAGWRYKWLSERDWRPASRSTTLGDEDTLSGSLVRRISLFGETEASTTVPVVEVEDAVWVDTFIDRCSRLLQLPDNWDSYGGEPVSSAVVLRALLLLTEVMTEDSPLPAVIPSSDGGVQLEWHRGGVEVEVYVPPSGKGYLYWQESETAEPLEREFSPELPSAEVTSLITKAVAQIPRL